MVVLLPAVCPAIATATRTTATLSQGGVSAATTRTATTARTVHGATMAMPLWAPQMTASSVPVLWWRKIQVASYEWVLALRLPAILPARSAQSVQRAGMALAVSSVQMATLAIQMV